MEIYIEKDDPYLWIKKSLAILIIVVLITGTLGTAIAKIFGVDDSSYLSSGTLAAVGGNTLVGVSNPAEPVRVKRVKVLVTGYSSTTWQTDDSPFITASGKYVEDGIIANNMLPFGTQVRIPELYGDKIFVVEDRMNSRKSHYHVDVWFEDYHQAKDFGVKTTYIEVLEG